MIRNVFCIACALTLWAVPAEAQRRGRNQPEPVSSEEYLRENASEEDWVTVDPENLLVLDLPSGQLIIEMRPDLAPRHIERVKTLVRRGFYNGTIFHRVIDGFMAQGGDPTGTGTGGSELPNLRAEFVKGRDEISNFVQVGRDSRSPEISFVGSVPVASQSPTLTEFVKTDNVAVWPMHCQGVVSMARAGDPNSANSQFFIMFGDNRRALDQQYTGWGRVVDGYVNVRRINRGEPPERPTPLLRARIMADLPIEEQTKVELLRVESETFKDWLKGRALLSEDGFFEDVCSVYVPVRIGGEIK